MVVAANDATRASSAKAGEDGSSGVSTSTTTARPSCLRTDRGRRVIVDAMRMVGNAEDPNGHAVLYPIGF